MARNYNTSVTSSINYLPFNLSASEGLTLNIDNPNQGSSYVVLETRRNSEGFYDENTPKDAQGTYTLTGVTNVVSDDYKAGFVIPPGGGTASFDNTNYVSGSDFRVVGTKYHPFYDALLDRWPNAAAAYSLRRLNSYYEGPAVRVRRSIDDQETDIGFNPVELDTATLINFATNAGTALPADYGDGAAAAYSLRYVSSTYSGAVVRVRRDSDDTELDFTPSEITDGTLEAWVGSGNNGFVETWYDQSGNGNNASQTVAANQPKIVNNGSILLENEKPSVQFDGIFNLLTDITFTNQSIFYLTTPYQDVNTSNRFRFYIGDATLIGGSVSGRATDETITLVKNTNDLSYIRDVLTANSQYLFNIEFVNSFNFFINGDQKTTYDGTSGALTQPTSITSIGSNSVDNLQQNVQEIIVYPSDQSSNRTDIESNINNYYNIFPFDAYVETWYDQSGNGNHASQTIAASQPQIVNSGSVVLENGKPAVEFDGSNDNLQYAGEILNQSTFVGFAVCSYSNTTITAIFDQSLNNGGAIFPTTGTVTRVFGVTSVGNVEVNGTPNPNQTLYTGQILSGNSILRMNGILKNTVTTTFTMSGNTGLNFVIGDDSPPLGSRALDGFINELIIYTTDQNSNITGIETDINSHYKIY